MADEILWNVGICASTYAELGEAWITIRKANLELDQPDGYRVLNESGAAPMFYAGQEMVEKAMRGLDMFLNIQGNYLDGIRKGVSVDMSELEQKIQKGQEEEYFKIRKHQGSIVARGRSADRASLVAGLAAGAGAEIYPGLYAYEAPPDWLNDWMQYVSYNTTGNPKVAPAASAKTALPWTDGVQYSV